MELSEQKNIRRILEDGGFTFKKSLGQNFLVNPEVCPAMAAAACTPDTGVLEIGPGAGVLTVELARRARRVIAIELDERLRPILEKSLVDFNNTKLIFADAMKADLAAIIKEGFYDCSRVTVCANLPYYITSPMVMKLLESRLPIDSITVMVQKEAAERLCAEVGSRAAGAVTAAVEYYAESKILFSVPRTSFIPVPKVDSAVIQLNVRKEAPVKVGDEKKLFALIHACFAQRRKTLVNTVSSTLGTDKEIIRSALEKMGLEATVRGETLSLSRLAELSELI